MLNVDDGLRWVGLDLVRFFCESGPMRNSECSTEGRQTSECVTTGSLAKLKYVRKQVVSTVVIVNPELHVVHVGTSAVDSVQDEHSYGQPATHGTHHHHHHHHRINECSPDKMLCMQ